MLRSHWRKVGYVVPFGLAALVILAASVNEAFQRPSTQSGAAQQHANANNSTQMRAAPSAVAKTPNPNPEPKRDEWRQEQDLIAQQDSARWGLLMLIVTTIGVVYVARTLDETRSATKAANKAANAAVKANETALLVGSNQSRAYMSIGLPRAPPDGDSAFVFALVNSGATPARGIHWEYRLRLGGWSLTTDDTRVRSQADIPGGGEPHDQSILVSQADWVRDAIGGLSLARRGRFHMTLRYRDVFGRCFELNERMELSGRRDNGTHDIFVSHVHSDEREISRAEYDQPIRLPEEVE